MPGALRRTCEHNYATDPANRTTVGGNGSWGAGEFVGDVHGGGHGRRQLSAVSHDWYRTVPSPDHW